MKSGFNKGFGLALVLICTLSRVMAQDVSFDVNGFILEGENPIGEEAAQAILEPFSGTQENLDGLERAAAELEKSIHDAGYTFYRVVLPPQTIEDGAIKLHIVRFNLGRITVVGNNFHSEENITRSLPGLKVGESPNAGELSKNLALANLNASKRAKLTFSPGAEAGTLDALVEVVDRNPDRYYLWVNDTGNEETGEYRTGVGFRNANFLGRDQYLTATATTSPTDIDQVSQFGLTWRGPHYSSNGMFNLYAIQSDVDSGTVAEFFQVRGSGTILGGGYSKFLPRIGAYRQILSTGLTDKLFDSDVDFSGQPIGVDVRSRPVYLNYHGEFQGENQPFNFDVSVNKNIKSGKYNDDETYAAARQGADADWTLLRFSMDTIRQFEKLTLRGYLSGQYADEPLIAGEQFGIGGANSVRGFSERELTGDRGIRASIEVVSPKFGKGFDVGWFVDGGTVERVQPAAGESASVDIVSTGMLLNWQPNRQWLLHTDFAYVLDISGDAPVGGTQEGDERVHFNVTYFSD
ncbi:MAG: hypothetical protein DHS20C01_18140 [marine bacterium B5-7]|nr:MAG: hypothetical protein DHS20C01_18140 [marine bacterium B5-7]